jgi:hypothetical protein
MAVNEAIIPLQGHRHGVLALMLVSLVFSCAAAGNTLIDEYSPSAPRSLEPPRPETPPRGHAGAQLQTIGQQLSKLKLNKAPEGHRGLHTNKIMPENARFHRQ